MPYKSFEKKKEYMKEYMERYRPEHREKLRENNLRSHRKHQDKARSYYIKLKQEILTHYGNGKYACIKCSESKSACLSLDHINGGGSSHKSELGISGGSGFYLWLRRNNYPKGYQTLCMNCQFVKRTLERECARASKALSGQN